MGMGEKILCFWLDFDGCFYAEHAKGTKKKEEKNGVTRVTNRFERDQPILFEGPIVKHMLASIETLKPDVIQISSFSNRQDMFMDNTNNYSKGSTSSIEIFTALHQWLETVLPDKKIVLDKFLLADTYTEDCRIGSVWDAILMHNQRTNGTVLKAQELPNLEKPLSIQIKAQKYKTDLFYCKAHHASQPMEGQTNHVHAIVYDDSEDILEELHKLFGDIKCQLLPRNFTANLFAFNAISQEKDERYRKQSAFRKRPRRTPQPSAPLEATANEHPSYKKVASDLVTRAIPACVAEATWQKTKDRTSVLPGADFRRPEHFPYRVTKGGSVGGSPTTFYNKGELAKSLKYAQLQDYKSSPFTIGHTIRGNGAMHLSGAHKMNYRLNKILGESRTQDTYCWYEAKPCNSPLERTDMTINRFMESLHSKLLAPPPSWLSLSELGTNLEPSKQNARVVNGIMLNRLAPPAPPATTAPNRRHTFNFGLRELERS